MTRHPVLPEWRPFSPKIIKRILIYQFKKRHTRILKNPARTVPRDLIGFSAIPKTKYVNQSI